MHQRMIQNSCFKEIRQKAKLPAEIFTYSFGIIGALVLGVGMCLSMKIIGGQSTLMEILGIIIGLIGIVMVGVNYPIYKKCQKMARKNMLMIL